MPQPIICFGQQPCGIFPRRFLYAKIATARRMQKQMGGEIVFFCHDSDHDFRETITILKNLKTGQIERLNFDSPNKIQKRFTPLYAKRVSEDWKIKTARRLPCYVGAELVEIFQSVQATVVAEFCLEMYRGMSLLEGIRVVKSSDPQLRQKAIEVGDYFVDLPYRGELVRARMRNGGLFLHKGGAVYEELPFAKPARQQISPARDTRLPWMQSIIQCTHYVAGAGEMQYLDRTQSPEINFIRRDEIERPDEAFFELP